MQKPRRRHRNDLGSVFAASVVTVLGAAISTILFTVGSPDSSPWLVGLIIVPAVLFLAALVGVRWPRLGTRLDFWHTVFRGRAGADHGLDYEPHPVRREAVKIVGQRKPITAEEVREIQLLSANTWVPVRGQKKDSPVRLKTESG